MPSIQAFRRSGFEAMNDRMTMNDTMLSPKEPSPRIVLGTQLKEPLVLSLRGVFFFNLFCHLNIISDHMNVELSKVESLIQCYNLHRAAWYKINQSKR